MNWKVLFHEEFEPEFDALPEEVQDEAFAHAKLLENLARSSADPQLTLSKDLATRI